MTRQKNMTEVQLAVEGGRGPPEHKWDRCFARHRLKTVLFRWNNKSSERGNHDYRNTQPGPSDATGGAVEQQKSAEEMNLTVFFFFAAEGNFIFYSL